MLIYIDPSLIEYFKHAQITSRDIEALENIILSHRNGYHFVTSNRKSLDFLKEMKDLSSISKKQLNILSLDYSTSGNFNEKIFSKIIVKSPNSPMKRIDNEIDSNIKDYKYKTSIFEMPLDYFNTAEVLEKTRLIAENLEDCNFFQFIGEEFFRKRNLLCSLKFDLLSGGGSELSKLFKQKITSNHIVFVLVDSDKKNPESCLGNTSQLVLEVFQEHNEDNIIGCEILPVHEKENLVSSVIYKYIGKSTNSIAIKQLEILEKNDPEHNFFRYLDIKEGLHSDNYTDHFDSIFDIPNLIPLSHENGRGFDKEFVGSKEEFLKYSEDQKNVKKADRKRKYLIQKLGSNPLNNFNLVEDRELLRDEIEKYSSKIPEERLLEKMEKLKILENIFDYLLEFQREYFLILGMQIQEWGLANPKRIA